MTKSEAIELQNACLESLANFIIRVSGSENATPAELAALPAIASIVIQNL